MRDSTTGLSLRSGAMPPAYGACRGVDPRADVWEGFGFPGGSSAFREPSELTCVSGVSRSPGARHDRYLICTDSGSFDAFRIGAIIARRPRLALSRPARWTIEPAVAGTLDQ